MADRGTWFLILDLRSPNLTTLLFSFARFLVAVGEKFKEVNFKFYSYGGY
jgi:hypothetical protein